MPAKMRQTGVYRNGDEHMIAIIMAVYNGETYLNEQIDSLLSNTEKDFVLHIFDDGSTDCSAAVIQSYTDKYPSKIFYHRNVTNQGVIHNFLNGCLQVDADYYMFCDQDDYWCEQKIEISLKRMYELESSSGEKAPCTVFTDLYVVDENLNIVNDSFFKAARMPFDVVNDLYKAMAVSVAPGCTMLMNKWVLDYTLPIPKTIIHDFWIIVLTAKYGKVACLNVPTIKYRQHGNNSIGSTLSGKKYIYNRLRHVMSWFRVGRGGGAAGPGGGEYLKFAYWKLYYIFTRI